MAKYVDWERIVSATLGQPAQPMTIHTRGIDMETGDIWDVSEPALGLLCEIVECYRRRARGDFDIGDPKLPPSPESLVEEGYTFDHIRTDVSFLENGDLGLMKVESCSNSESIVLLSTELVPDSWKEEVGGRLLDARAERVASHPTKRESDGN